MPDVKLDTYIAAVATHEFSDMGPRVTDVLDQIGEAQDDRAQGFRLLALRRYLRVVDEHTLKGMRERWTWTAEEATTLSNVGTAKLLMEEAAGVQKRFAEKNPGCTLALSPLRSLESQVSLWKGNPTVQLVAPVMRDTIIAEIASADYPDQPTDQSIGKFTTALRKYKPQPEPTSAAPGTSDHGQLRAVDFVVLEKGRQVAGTTSSTIDTVWKKGGWEAKLIAACAGSKLVGPLQNPYEPWHWRLV